MSSIRVDKHTRNFTIVDNTCLKDDGLSARAKGIFVYLMSLPHDWVIVKKELFTHFKEGEKALETAFKELRDSGYLTKEPTRKNNGQLSGWDWTIHETPVCNNKKQNDVKGNGNKPYDTSLCCTEHPISARSVSRATENGVDGFRELLSTEVQSTERKVSTPPLPPPSEDEFEEEEKSISVTWRDYPSVGEFLQDNPGVSLTASDFLSIWSERSVYTDRKVRPTPKNLKKVEDFAEFSECDMNYLCSYLSDYCLLIADDSFPQKQEIYRLDTWFDDFDHVRELVRRHRDHVHKKTNEQRAFAFRSFNMPFIRATEAYANGSIRKLDYTIDPDLTSHPYILLLCDLKANDLMTYHLGWLNLPGCPKFEFLEAFIEKNYPHLLTRFHKILETYELRRP